MDTRAINIVRALGWGGALPFVFIPPIAFLPAPAWAERLAVAYATVILSFMAGTLWARHLLLDRIRLPLLIGSNVLVLLAWPALLMPLYAGCLWLGALFIAHLLLDEPWRSHGLPGWYRRLRLGLSSAVITLLIIAGLIDAGRLF
jgi:hypothetical protein